MAHFHGGIRPHHPGDAMVFLQMAEDLKTVIA
jgi:hypothetical protein